MAQILETGRYVVVAKRPWNQWVFHTLIKQLPGTWHITDNHAIDEPGVDLYFYMDCEVIIEPKLIAQGNRIGFHTGPFRGGSPIQNTIERGVDIGQLICFVMAEKADNGKILCRAPLPLLGLAEEIYQRLALACYSIMHAMSEKEMEPGDEVIEGQFLPRRSPDQSVIGPQIESMTQLFDHIRMLDAQGYPHAFIRHGPFKIYFSRPALRTGSIQADVVITADP